MADIQEESLSKLTVAELKNELSSRNLSTSGLKDELVARLREAIEKEQSGDKPDNVSESSKTAEEDKFMKILSLMSVMKAGQEEMKDEIKAGQQESKERHEEMKERVDGIVNLVNTRVDAIEEKVEILEVLGKKSEERFIEMEGKLEKLEGNFEGKMEGKFEEFEGNIEGKFKEFEEKLKELEQGRRVQAGEEVRETDRTFQEFVLPAFNQFQDAHQPLPIVNKPYMKLLPYDGKTSWQVYKTQFSIVAEANGWDSITKARQLASSLRAEAADILRTVPENEQLNIDSLSSALEMRFGEKCLKDYSRLQLKTRQQRPNESLQELATDIEKLSHLAFSDCPTEVRETLAVQYFVDGVRDTEIQRALRMAENKDLKAALVYAIKFEAAQQASRRDRHSIRGAEIKPDEDPLLKVMTQLLEEFKKMQQKSGEEAGKSKKINVRCWKCGSEGHLQRQCQASQDQRLRSLPRNHNQEN